MSKSSRALALLLFALAPASVRAADEPTVPNGPPIGAPPGAYDPVTVGDYLAKCENMGSKLTSSDGSLCTFPLNITAALQLQNNPHSLCLKSAPGDSPETFNSVMAWLKAHPELKNTSKEEGASLAVNALYRCPGH